MILLCDIRRCRVVDAGSATPTNELYAECASRPNSSSTVETVTEGRHKASSSRTDESSNSHAQLASESRSHSDQTESANSTTTLNGIHVNNVRPADDVLVESLSRPITADSRADSRASTADSRADSRANTADSRADSRAASSRPSSSSSLKERKQPFLPEIDPRGRMSTQRQVGGLELSESLRHSGKPLLAKAVWSSFSDTDTTSTTSQVLGLSQDQELASEALKSNSAAIPHPPLSSRKSKVKDAKRTQSAAD